MDDERALVERARSDPEAFAVLYRRHVERIHRFAERRTGSRQAAEDVTAATFERALAKLHRFRWGPGGFAPWLYRLAANEVAEHHRGRARHRSDRAVGVVSRFRATPDGDTPEHRAVDADEHRRVRDALSRLTGRHRRVLELTYFTDLDRDGVAVALDLSPRSYAVALHRAKHALRRILEEDPT